MSRPHAPAALALLVALAPAAAAQAGAVVTFDNGAEGWSINGWDQPDAAGGNPGANLHWDDFVDTFGLSVRTSTDADFLGDYGLLGGARLAIDVQVDSIAFFGTPVPRELVVILYDDDPFDGAPPAAVWRSLGTLNGNGSGWQTYATRVSQVLSDDLPAGWKGAGAEDPVTFEPVLPAGRTWANVLRGVDRVEFTTFVPGFFYGFTNFDLRVDNVSIQPTGPSTWVSLGQALAGAKGEPFLSTSGDLSAGSPNAVRLSNAAPGAFAALLYSATSSPVPFFGGTLVPFPFNDPIYLTTLPAGTAELAFTMPAGVPPGAPVYAQFGLVDLSAPQGVALSNAAVGTAP